MRISSFFLPLILSIFPLSIPAIPLPSIASVAELPPLTKDHLKALEIPARIEIFDTVSAHANSHLSTEALSTVLDSILEYADSDPNLQFANYLIHLPEERFENLQTRLTPQLRRWIYDALMIHYTLEAHPAFLQALSRLWESQLASDIAADKAHMLEMVEWVVLQNSRESYTLLLLLLESDCSVYSHAHRDAIEIKRRIARALQSHFAHSEALTIHKSSAADRNHALAAQRLSSTLIRQFVPMKENPQLFRSWSHTASQVLRMYRTSSVHETVHFLPLKHYETRGIHLSPVKSTGHCQVIFLARDLN